MTPVGYVGGCMKLKFIALASFMSIVLLLNAQGLREMEAKPMKAPAVYTVFLSNPEDGALVIYSTIPNLKFDSNMKGIVKTTEKPDEGKYVLFLKTMTSQIIIVKAMGYVECHIPVRNLQAQEGRYYSVEPKLDADDVGFGNLSITSTPSAASIDIEGIPHGVAATPYEFKKLSTNTYRIVLKKHRYQDKELLVRVEKDKDITKSVTLDPNWADLTITSEPSNCRVYLDNAYVGNTPISYRGIERGLDPKRYNIRIEKPNDYYLDGIKILELKAMDDINEHFALEDISGYLNFARVNKDYNIFINGDYIGPQVGINSIRLIRGEYQIRCEAVDNDAEFFQPWSTSINLQKSESIDIVPDLVGKYAYLTLRVNTAGVEVFLNNKKHEDLSSRLNTTLSPKKYSILVRKTGEKANAYRSWQDEITLKEQEDKILDVVLEPIRGRLDLSSNTPQTQYTVVDTDLNRIVSQNQLLQHYLLVGNYDITASAKGYMTESKSINLKAKQPSYVNFSLQTYAGSIQQKKSFWNKNMYTGLVLTAINGAAIYYSWDKYNSYYDEYQIANSSGNAVASRDQTIKWQDSFKLSQYAITVPITYTLFSLIEKSIYKNKILKSQTTGEKW